MQETKMDLILHPIRLGIVQNLIGGRKLTAQQISDLLSDVPQATLYRHLNKLLKAGIISVAEENPIRGTIEKVYCINQSAFETLNQEQTKISKADHLKYFFTFLMSMMDDFEKYIHGESTDLIKDGLSYRRGKYYLTDAEFEGFLRDMKNAFEKIAANEPTSERKGRNIGLIIIPDTKKPKD